MKASLTVDAVAAAISQRDPQGTLIHRARGSQFRSEKYVPLISSAGLQSSMGRVGACAVYAAMESFFSLLQKNVLNQKRWETRAELRLVIVFWIEKTYHHRRRRLGKLPPSSLRQ